MISDDLEVKIRQVCEEENLDCRKIDEICAGMHLKFNDFLKEQDVYRELAFRIPMQVVHVRRYRFDDHLTRFPICPRCGDTMEWEYQEFCDRCGQQLNWKGYRKATILMND